MRKKDNESKVKKPFYKRWWFIGIVLLTIIGAIGSGGEDATTEQPQESASSAVEEKQDTVEPKQEEKVEVKREDMNLDQYLEHMVKEVIGEETNMDKPVFVSISDGDEGIKDITLNPNDNFTNNMIVGGILRDASDYYKAIKDDEEVKKLKGVSLIYQMTLVDKLGNESINPVLILTVSPKTMNKINWDNFIADNLTDVADTYFLHPVLKD